MTGFEREEKIEIDFERVDKCKKGFDAEGIKKDD